MRKNLENPDKSMNSEMVREKLTESKGIFVSSAENQYFPSSC